MKKIDELIQEHPFFKDFDPKEIKLISGCGQNRVYQKGEMIAQENEPANEFYLIRQGMIAVNTLMPNRDTQTIETLNAGDIFGWSWAFEPYQWMFEAKALDTVHVIALDGICLRKKCDADPELGYKIIKRFAQLIIQRLQATRLQLLDVYGSQS